MNHEFYMDLALKLARSGYGQAQPNPMVGAVIVKDGEIVGMGAHLKAGEPHAEVHAFAMAKEKAQGATLYVTLEPCSHFGRTPPCAEAVIRSGISKVVIATLDPNPLVAGRGKRMLEEAGIEVLVGVRADESRQLNEIFNCFITTKKPFVTIKTASTLDGKIATVTGSSRWITSGEAREQVHHLRNVYQAILVGVNTVIEDNPELTTRLPDGGRNPIRVILDSKLRTPMDAKVIIDRQAPTWIYTTFDAPEARKEELEQQGIKVIPVCKGSRVEIPAVLSHLGEQGISSLLVEGGSQVNGAFLTAKAINKVICYLSPKLVGGLGAPTPYGGIGVQEMNQAVQITNFTVTQVGRDVCIEGYPLWEA
ncbi:MAG TPA: bifunctional diaminohydroxyphosphoribosylaminopyrimidine deaminase/5-amino-6-(5-phosphoribosylamino)uracil reductase RibD [Bacillota bacterium]|nr:bifunctional diaminohydroxyphosphoribosylaminopyrimidine deaminase/5-amino-6-(5-phosphoribosylamino)uracil reductase RibD [Bacillota bacterium]